MRVRCVMGLVGVGLLVFNAPCEGADDVLAGVARAQFTLPPHVSLAGYSRRRGKPSRGVHDSVGVRALVITDGDVTAALVSCDLLIIDDHLFNAVRQRLGREGFPSPFVLVLAGTHTHSGPGAYGTTFLEKISMGHFDPRVFDILVDDIARAVVRAYADRRAFRSASAATPTSGLVVNRATPGGIVDDELAISAFYWPKEARPFAVLVDFAAHPTTLGAGNLELSADYPGVVMRELERRLPGTTGLFFAGAVGDQAPVKAGEGFEMAERLGRQLAEQTMALLETAHPELPRSIDAVQRAVHLPPAHVRLGRRLALPAWLGRRFVDEDATVSLVRVGTAVYIGMPCDVAAALGHDVKHAARAHGFQPMLIGFASDYIGYCVPETLYRTARYEASMAWNGPTTGALIVEQVRQMLDAIAAARH